MIPGAAVRMTNVRDLDDVFEVDVAGKSLVIGSEGLEGVMVEVARRRGERISK